MERIELKDASYVHLLDTGGPKMVPCSTGACWALGMLHISHQPLRLLLHPVTLPQGKTKLPDCSSVASLCVTFTFHSPDNPLVCTDLPEESFAGLWWNAALGHGHPFQKKVIIPQSNSSQRSLSCSSQKHQDSFTSLLSWWRRWRRKSHWQNCTISARECMTFHKTMVPSAEDVLGEQFSQTAKIVCWVRVWLWKISPF